MNVYIEFSMQGNLQRHIFCDLASAESVLNAHGESPALSEDSVSIWVKKWRKSSETGLAIRHFMNDQLKSLQSFQTEHSPPPPIKLTICFKLFNGLWRFMILLWILIWYLSLVLLPSPHGIFLHVILRYLVGILIGPFTINFFFFYTFDQLLTHWRINVIFRNTNHNLCKQEQ